jgi:hypothetical protein
MDRFNVWPHSTPWPRNTRDLSERTQENGRFSCAASSIAALDATAPPKDPKYLTRLVCAINSYLLE